MEKINYRKNSEYSFERSSAIQELKATQIANIIGKNINLNNKDLVNFINKNNNFKLIAYELEKNISKFGRYLLIFVPINNEWNLILADPIDFTEVNNKLTKITFESTNIYYKNGTSYPINYRYEILNNVIYLYQYIYIENIIGNIKPTKTYINNPKKYKFSSIPGHLFINNLEMNNDAEKAGIISELYALDHMTNILIDQTYLSLAMLTQNSALTDDSAESTLLAIKRGKQLLENKSFAGRLGLGLQFTNTNNSFKIIQDNILFLESSIYEKLNIPLPSLGEAKSNKHNMEIILKYENLLKEVSTKRDHRVYDWNIFANNAIKFFNSNKIVSFSNKTQVTIDYDKITKTLFKLLKFQIQFNPNTGEPIEGSSN